MAKGANKIGLSMNVSKVICVDCKEEGITTVRPTDVDEHPRKPRCATHKRARKTTQKIRNHGKRIETVYGITGEQYQRILNYQGGVCAICGPITGRKGASRRLSVDHNHKTGEVRGLLCMTCNDYIGLIKEDLPTLYRATQYLVNPPTRRMGKLYE